VTEAILNRFKRMFGVKVKTNPPIFLFN